MFTFSSWFSVRMVGVELSAELHKSLWQAASRREEQVNKDHLWQRLGQDEDKEELGEEDDEVT